MGGLGTRGTLGERALMLERVNPVVKLGLSLSVILLLSFLFDPFSSAGLGFFGLFLGLALSRLSPGKFLKAIWPFLLLGLGFLTMNAFLPRERDLPLWMWGPFVVTPSGLENGLVFFLRSWGFGTWSALFALTTPPSRFLRSLVHQLGVDQRLAFASLAAYRALPFLTEEYRALRAAHRLRWERLGRRSALLRAGSFTLALLASGLKRAQRVALALEARGLSDRPRNWLWREKLSGLDAAYASLVLAGVTVVLGICQALGWLRLWSGRLW